KPRAADGLAALRALDPGACHARADALSDHRPLKLGEDAHHLKHGTARWRRRIEPLLMQIKLGTTGVNLAQERDQILQRAPQPIAAPSHDDAKPPAGRIPTQAVEGRALVATLGAADAVVRINVDDLVAQALGHGPKL